MWEVTHCLSYGVYLNRTQIASLQGKVLLPGCQHLVQLDRSPHHAVDASAILNSPAPLKCVSTTAPRYLCTSLTATKCPSCLPVRQAINTGQNHSSCPNSNRN